MTEIDFMTQALNEARLAFNENEIPVGAVIVKDNVIIARAHNTREKEQNALCHAEIMAINEACRVLGTWRLDGCEIFVTLEPCPMCAGAILNSRIRRTVFGANDAAMGAAGSIANLFAMPFEHTVLCKSGVCKDECAKLLNDFFVKIRAKGRDL